MPAGIRGAKGLFKSALKKKRSQDKIRIGVIVGKAHDPITQNQARKLAKRWPECFKIKNNTGPNAAGWGGQYQIDSGMGLTLEKMHPDVFDVDIVPGEQVTPARLQGNHLNFNLAYDMVNATMSGNKKHMAEVEKAFKDPKSHLWPEWDLQEFIYDKTKYMRALEKAGIPVIPSIYVTNGFKAQPVLKQVQEKGWKKFFIKPGRMGSFGLAAFNGATADCVKDASLLQNFSDGIDHANYKIFLVQPYMLKPNGNVFDEIRHFFIDGQWAYAVYTDGTDDDAVYPEPEGPRMKASKALAMRGYAEFLKQARWRGKSFVPPFTRLDIGLMPVPGKSIANYRYFINEIEMEACTWLVRYCPFDLVSRMGGVYTAKIQELLDGLDRAGEKIKDAAVVRKCRAALEAKASKAAANAQEKKKSDPKRVRSHK